MQRRMDRLCAFDLILRAKQIVLCTLHLEYSALQLRIQLRHFQDRQGLALAHPVSYVHIDLHHEASHLGVNIHYLIRLELSGEAQSVCNVAALCRRHFRRRNLCGVRAGVLTLRVTRNDGSQDRKYYSRGEDRGGSLSHNSIAPLCELWIVRGRDGRTRSQTENACRCIRPVNLIKRFSFGCWGMARREREGGERSGFLSERDGKAATGLHAVPAGLIRTGSIC